MIKVADVEWCVDNVETGEDDRDQRCDDRDGPDDDVDEGHGPGLPQLVPSGQSCDSLDQIQGPSPVSLSVRDFIPRKWH